MKIVLFVSGCVFIIGGIGLWIGLLYIRKKNITIEKKMIILYLLAGALNVVAGLTNIRLALMR